MSDYLTKSFNLKNKTAVLIGGAGYLLSEMAKGLLCCGVRVAILDRNEAQLKKTVGSLRKTGGKIIGIPLDAVSKEDHERALKVVLKNFKGVDILINGAGINAPTPFLEITLQEWYAILETHVTGTFLACQVFGKHMVSRKKGSIINMSSASSGPPLSKAFTYSVAKAGIKNLTQNLAREWAPYRVRVNALKPGFFPTNWSKKYFIDKKRQAAILNHTPMGRYGRPEELVGAVLWLSSDAASFVTGTEITVDGGFTCMTI